MPRFTTLYSGSSGNAAVVEEDGLFLLVDMGGSCRATLRGLAEIGLAIEGLQGILVTHEHSDHIRGLNVFLRRHPVPLFASLATIDALYHMDAVPDVTELVAVDSREEEIAGFKVCGFPTSHDAAGCCGFRVVTPGGGCMAIATDLGVITVDVYQQLQDAGLVALEANYDRQMLRTGRYPAYLKARIASQRGHLSNEMSAQTVVRLIREGCRRVALCHLSEENNLPGLAMQAVQDALFEAGLQQPAECVVQVSRRHEPSPWLEF